MARTIAQALIINRQSLPKAIVHAYLTCVPLGTLRVVVCVAWSYPRVIISCDKNCSSINSWYSCFSRDKLQVPQSASAASTGVGLTRRARCGERDRGWAWNFACAAKFVATFWWDLKIDLYVKQMWRNFVKCNQVMQEHFPQERSGAQRSWQIQSDSCSL